MAHWIPVARHYQVDGGYLTVLVAQFFESKGTSVFYVNEDAVAYTMDAIAEFPEGTTYEEALAAIGYTVVDEIGEPEPAADETEPIVASPTLAELLPPEILAVLSENITVPGTEP